MFKEQKHTFPASQHRSRFAIRPSSWACVLSGHRPTLPWEAGVQAGTNTSPPAAAPSPHTAPPRGGEAGFSAAGGRAPSRSCRSCPADWHSLPPPMAGQETAGERRAAGVDANSPDLRLLLPQSSRLSYLPPPLIRGPRRCDESSRTIKALPVSPTHPSRKAGQRGRPTASLLPDLGGGSRHKNSGTSPRSHHHLARALGLIGHKKSRQCRYPSHVLSPRHDSRPGGRHHDMGASAEP